MVLLIINEFADSSNESITYVFRRCSIWPVIYHLQNGRQACYHSNLEMDESLSLR